MRRWCLLLSMFPLLAGCNGADEPIKSYTATDPNRKEIRLLAGIIPLKQKNTLVFKLSGPKVEVDKRRSEFLAFIDSFQLSDPNAWKVPADWRRQRGGELRPIWYYIPGPTDKESLECTLSPLQGEEASSVLKNVNRWRKQLTLPPVGPKELTPPMIVTKEIDSEKLEVILVDLLGYSDYTPPARPADEARPPPPPRADMPFEYKLPEGWSVKPVSKPLILQTIQVAANTEVTISALAGEGGGLDANINRWRGQIQLPPATDDEFFKGITKLEMPLTKMLLVDLHNPKLDGRNRILAAIFTYQERTWFIKMTGASEEVERNKKAMQSFLESFKQK